jgi:hypothetical protein
MSESIRVDVARECDLAEISGFLAGRGFTTEQVQTTAAWHSTSLTACPGAHI